MTIRHMRIACWIIGYRHTIRICNTYCFFAAKMVTRTRLNITLYINYLSCCPVRFLNRAVSVSSNVGAVMNDEFWRIRLTGVGDRGDIIYKFQIPRCIFQLFVMSLFEVLLGLMFITKANTTLAYHWIIFPPQLDCPRGPRSPLWGSSITLI
jgi:hypothetical protein